jgi:hypothetical protein
MKPKAPAPQRGCCRRTLFTVCLSVVGGMAQSSDELRDIGARRALVSMQTTIATARHVYFPGELITMNVRIHNPGTATADVVDTRHEDARHLTLFRRIERAGQLTPTWVAFYGGTHRGQPQRPAPYSLAPGQALAHVVSIDAAACRSRGWCSIASGGTSACATWSLHPLADHIRDSGFRLEAISMRSSGALREHPSRDTFRHHDTPCFLVPACPG